MPTMCYSPGQLMSWVRTLFGYSYNNMTAGAWDVDFTLDTWNGYRHIDFMFKWNGGELWGDDCVLLTLQGEEVAPFDYFARSPGWDGTSVINWVTATGAPGTWTDCVGVWTDTLLPIKKALIDGWTFGSWQSHSVNAVLAAAGNAGQALCPMIVLADQAYFCSQEQMNGANVDPGGGPGWYDPFAIPAPGVEGNPSIVLSTGNVASAIRDLANVDTAISFNQGAAIYSVKNREVTEP